MVVATRDERAGDAEQEGAGAEADQEHEPGRKRVQVRVPLRRERAVRVRSVCQRVAELVDGECRKRQQQNPAAGDDPAGASGGHARHDTSENRVFPNPPAG